MALVGPRQRGKTTLAQQLGGVYFDMETDGSEARLDAEWETLVAGRQLIMIDEVQNAPWVFSRLRGTIDADRKRNGRFLLLGSVSPGLMENVSQSLAGRLGLVRMTPFILPHLKARQMDILWLRGGYPDGGILVPFNVSPVAGQLPRDAGDTGPPELGSAGKTAADQAFAGDAGRSARPAAERLIDWLIHGSRPQDDPEPL